MRRVFAGFYLTQHVEYYFLRGTTKTLLAIPVWWQHPDRFPSHGQCNFRQDGLTTLYRTFSALPHSDQSVCPNDKPLESVLLYLFLSPFSKIKYIGQLCYILMIGNIIIPQHITKVPKLCYNFLCVHALFSFM